MTPMRLICGPSCLNSLMGCSTGTFMLAPVTFFASAPMTLPHGRSKAQELLEGGQHRLGIVLVQRVDGPRDLDELPPGELLGHPLGDLAVEDHALLAAQHEGGDGNRLEHAPPVDVELGPLLLDAGMQ